MTEEDVRQVTESAKYILRTKEDVFSKHILTYISFLEKENAELKAQIEKLKCGHSYVVSDDHSNSVPCYTVYECKYCSKR